MADEVWSFLKLHPALWPPPPCLETVQKQPLLGRLLSLSPAHCMGQESRSSQKWDQVWPLLQSGCYPFSSPDFLVSALNLSSVEHNHHREASLHSGLPRPMWRGSKVRKSRWIPRSRVRHHWRSRHLEGCRGAGTVSPSHLPSPKSQRTQFSRSSYFSTLYLLDVSN